MIISDLNYLETAIESNNLEGGVDFSVNLTHFQQSLSVMQTASNSGPNGSTAVTSGGLLQIDTSAFNAVVLGG